MSGDTLRPVADGPGSTQDWSGDVRVGALCHAIANAIRKCGLMEFRVKAFNGRPAAEFLADITAYVLAEAAEAAKPQYLGYPVSVEVTGIAEFMFVPTRKYREMRDQVRAEDDAWYEARRAASERLRPQ